MTTKANTKLDEARRLMVEDLKEMIRKSIPAFRDDMRPTPLEVQAWKSGLISLGAGFEVLDRLLELSWVLHASSKTGVQLLYRKAWFEMDDIVQDLAERHCATYLDEEIMEEYGGRIPQDSGAAPSDAQKDT